MGSQECGTDHETSNSGVAHDGCSQSRCGLTSLTVYNVDGTDSSVHEAQWCGCVVVHLQALPHFLQNSLPEDVCLTFAGISRGDVQDPPHAESVVQSLPKVISHTCIVHLTCLTLLFRCPEDARDGHHHMVDDLGSDVQDSCAGRGS